MKKPFLVVLALSVFAAFLVAGCGGGGGGAVITVEPKGGGKMCVPKDSAKFAAQTTETTTGLQGSAAIGDLAGDILVTLTPTTYEDGSMEFTAIVDGLDTSTTAADCGTIRLDVTGSVCGTTGEISASIDPPVTDTCGGTYSGSLAGTTTTTGAEGTASVTYTLDGTTENLSGTWSAEFLNCVRIALSGAVTPNTVTVGVSTQTDFDLIVYDLACNELTPLTSSVSSSACTATEATCWSADSSLGSIDSSGILTSTSTVSTVSGSLSLTYGPLTDSITVSVEPSTSEIVASHVSAAKGYLFKKEVSQADFDSAKTEITAALTADPDHPDANLLKALVDIGTEVERWDTEVEFTAETNFPYIDSYRMATKTLGDAVEPVVDFVSSPYPRQAVRLSSDDPENSEVQTEVETNTLPVIDGVVTALEYVKSYIDSNPTWAFAYPKDVDYPELGDNYIDATDVKALLGAAYLLKGEVNFGLAYQCDYDEDTWEATDNNPADGKLSPDEQFPNTACGTLRTNGSSYLSTAQTYFASGLSLLDTAVQAILAEATPTMGGETLVSDDITDANHYQHYLTELAASFGGTATSITIPKIVKCYWEDGGYIYSDEIFDPDYNTDDTAKCQVMITAQPETTVSVKFSGMTSPAISDWRSLTPNLIIYSEGDVELVESSGGSMVLPDSTMNGIFPSGVQASWFEWTTPEYDIYITIVDSGGNAIDCTSLYSGATLTVGGKTLTASSCWSTWDSANSVWVYNKLEFHRCLQTGLPADSDAITVNELIGTQASLSVSGYQAKTFMMDDTHFNATLTLTP